LEVLAEEHNSPPHAEILTPKLGEVYYTDEEIKFTQASYDKDDEITILWEFGDDTTSTKDNPIHSYSTLGQKIITLTVKDDRELDDEDKVSILIIESDKKGEYVFAHIDRPEWGEDIIEQEVSFNATSSYAIETTNCPSCTINCLAGGCPEKTHDTGQVINGGGKKGDYSNLSFSWSFDDFATYNKKGEDGVLFKKGFSTAGRHWAKLEVSLNPSSETETEFTTTFKSKCVEAGSLWYDGNGEEHYTLRENWTSCVGLDGVIGFNEEIGYIDDCCPVGFECTRGEGLGCQPMDEDDLCMNIASCFNYDNETGCIDDVCRVGKSGGRGVGTEICGQTFFVDFNGGEWNIVTDDSCRCAWTGTECIFKYNVSETFYTEENNLFLCEKKFKSGECMGGKMDISWTARAVWKPGKEPQDENKKKKILEQSRCVDGNDKVNCGEPLVKLSFFTLISLMATICAIVIIYAVWISGKKKSKKKGKKK